MNKWRDLMYILTDWKDKNWNIIGITSKPTKINKYTVYMQNFNKNTFSIDL